MSVRGGTLAIGAVLAIATTAAAVVYLRWDIDRQEPAPSSLHDQNHTQEVLRDVSARLDAIEKRLVDLESRPETGSPFTAGASGHGGSTTRVPVEEDVPQHIQRALQDQQEQAVERRIEIRQQEVDSAIDRYLEEAELSEEQVALLRRSLGDSVEQLTALTEEGKNAVRPWSEIRPEINRVHEEIVEELRGAFSEEEITELADSGLIVYQAQGGAAPSTAALTPDL